MSGIEGLIERILASPTLAVVAVAGSGSRAISWLLGVAGASQTLLEVVMPYGQRSMVDLLGREPAQSVSPQTARDMARVAYRRALRLRQGNSPVVGLASTATIATDRPKRGDHRCCVAAWDDAGVATYNLRLAKGQRDRAGEEEVVSRLIVHSLARACGVEPDVPLELLETERLDVRCLAHANPIPLLLAGEARTVTTYPDGRMVVDEPLPAAVVLPGSFDPLHRGHEQLARVASEFLEAGVVFEMSVVNVDKPPLKEAEVQRRLRQFTGRGRIVLTKAATFRQKADLFPGCTFVIGWDTAVRLVHSRYYGGGERAMLTALAEMWATGCRFLVAGREHNGSFRTLAEVPIPHGFRYLFQAIPESRFRVDTTSTSLHFNPGG